MPYFAQVGLEQVGSGPKDDLIVAIGGMLLILLIVLVAVAGIVVLVLFVSSHRRKLIEKAIESGQPEVAREYIRKKPTWILWLVGGWVLVVMVTQLVWYILLPVLVVIGVVGIYYWQKQSEAESLGNAPRRGAPSLAERPTSEAPRAGEQGSSPQPPSQEPPASQRENPQQ